MKSQTVSKLFELDETYTRNPDGSITGPFYEPSEIDDCPFDWDESKPNCRIYDPAFYIQRQSIQKESGLSDDIMPFGKFKGSTFKEMPINYLDWMAENFKTGKVKKWGKMADTELKRRNQVR
jgi:uncharacterized protein (DUF3820 family)